MLNSGTLFGAVESPSLVIMPVNTSMLAAGPVTASSILNVYRGALKTVGKSLQSVTVKVIIASCGVYVGTDHSWLDTR